MDRLLPKPIETVDVWASALALILYTNDSRINVGRWNLGVSPDRSDQLLQKVCMIPLCQWWIALAHTNYGLKLVTITPQQTDRHHMTHCL
jgi:hypothetical protein